MFDQIVNFIRDVYSTREYIHLHEPKFLGNEKKYLLDCIDSTYVSSVGKYVDRFEEMAASYTGATYAIVIVNGTAALHLALKLTGITPGDEVITQPLTFVATGNSIVHAGAKPVFLDVDEHTLGLSPDSLSDFLLNHAIMENDMVKNKLTGNRIKACVPMHSFGHPARIDEIVEICNQFQIPVIEDAAESIGSTFHGKHTGTFGQMGILSFNGNKTITTGGGGMILTDDRDLARRAKHMSTQAKKPHPWEFQHDEIGFNYRMPNINAALGVAQMESLDLMLSKKRELAKKYQTYFENIGVNFIAEPAGARSNYWMNSILLSNENERNDFLKYTNEHGVMTRPVWTLLHQMDIFKDCLVMDVPKAEWFAQRLVNIPSSILID